MSCGVAEWTMNFRRNSARCGVLGRSVQRNKQNMFEVKHTSSAANFNTAVNGVCSGTLNLEQKNNTQQSASDSDYGTDYNTGKQN